MYWLSMKEFTVASCGRMGRITAMPAHCESYENSSVSEPPIDSEWLCARKFDTPHVW